MSSILPSKKDNEKEVESVKESYRNVLNKIKNNEVKKEDFEKLKMNFKYCIIEECEYARGRAEIIDKIGINGTRNLFETVDGLTPQDLQEFAKKYLS